MRTHGFSEWCQICEGILALFMMGIMLWRATWFRNLFRPRGRFNKKP